MNEETTAIQIINWEAALNEQHDLMEYRAEVKVEEITGYYFQTIKGYLGLAGNTYEEALINTLSGRFGCDKEWIWVQPKTTAAI